MSFHRRVNVTSLCISASRKDEFISKPGVTVLALPARRPGLAKSGGPKFDFWLFLQHLVCQQTRQFIFFFNFTK